MQGRQKNDQHLFGGWRISILLDGGAMNVNVSRKMMVKMLKIKWLVGWMDGNGGEEQEQHQCFIAEFAVMKI
jgi:hypothetical protein